MGGEYPEDIRIQAEELFVCDGLTYERVADATGVSATQLKRWGAEGGWMEARRQYRQDMASIRRNSVKLRRELLEKAITSRNPQDVYAVASLERIYARSTSKGDGAQASLFEGDPVTISTMGDAAEALKGIIERKLGLMMSQPGAINLAGVKDAKAAIELAEKLSAQFVERDAPVEKKLDEDTLKAIREQVYGL